jgi:hypothetical protein
VENREAQYVRERGGTQQPHRDPRPADAVQGEAGAGDHTRDQVDPRGHLVERCDQGLPPVAGSVAHILPAGWRRDRELDPII